MTNVWEQALDELFGDNDLLDDAGAQLNDRISRKVFKLLRDAGIPFPEDFVPRCRVVQTETRTELNFEFPPGTDYEAIGAAQDAFKLVKYTFLMALNETMRTQFSLHPDDRARLQQAREAEDDRHASFGSLSWLSGGNTFEGLTHTTEPSLLQISFPKTVTPEKIADADYRIMRVQRYDDVVPDYDFQIVKASIQESRIGKMPFSVYFEVPSNEQSAGVQQYILELTGKGSAGRSFRSGGGGILASRTASSHYDFHSLREAQAFMDALSEDPHFYNAVEKAEWGLAFAPPHRAVKGMGWETFRDRVAEFVAREPVYPAPEAYDAVNDVSLITINDSRNRIGYSLSIDVMSVRGYERIWSLLQENLGDTGVMPHMRIRASSLGQGQHLRLSVEHLPMEQLLEILNTIHDNLSPELPNRFHIEVEKHSSGVSLNAERSLANTKDKLAEAIRYTGGEQALRTRNWGMGGV